MGLQLMQAHHQSQSGSHATLKPEAKGTGRGSAQAKWVLEWQGLVVEMQVRRSR